MDLIFSIGFWEWASYVVTTLGLPFAILIYIEERRKERDNDDEAAYQLLHHRYDDYLNKALEHPDLRLRSGEPTMALSPEQHERKLVIFEKLVALFECAYIVSYRPNLRGVAQRRWNSWDDFMREAVRRPDFHALLPSLLRGEDADFAAYILRLDAEENAASVTRPTYPATATVSNGAPV